MPMDEAKNESKGFAFIEFLDKKVCSVFLSFFFWVHASPERKAFATEEEEEEE